MVKIYTLDEIKVISESGKILATVFKQLKQEIKIGISLKYLDSLAQRITRENGAQPAFWDTDQKARESLTRLLSALL